MEDPPDPRRIDTLREEIESDLETLRRRDDSAGPTLDTIASKLDEMISLVTALEARDRQVNPKTRAVLWYLGVRITAEIIKRIVSATHNCHTAVRRAA